MERSKRLLFADLVSRVQRCDLCPRMKGRRKVLGPSNGNPDSPIVFIGEAPGRLGADKHGIPLWGDQTGKNFEALITSAGLRRETIFITNAILCNPRTLRGNNDSPSKTEIRNCSGYLSEVLQIVGPKYVVPLGAIALASLNFFGPHGIKLSEGVGKVFQWQGYAVYPLYHPGPRAFVWRTKAQQIEDYKNLAALLDSSVSVA